MTMTEETRIALVEQNMTELKQEISDIKTELKALSMQINTMLSSKLADHVEMKAEIKSLSEKLVEIEKRSNLWKWLSPTLSAVLGAFVTFLLMSYLQNLK